MAEHSPPRLLRCHRCRSFRLIMRETRYDHAEWDGGLYVNGEGRIVARGEGTFTPGDIQHKLSEIECEGCGHSWHPRRIFNGSGDGYG